MDNLDCCFGEMSWDLGVSVAGAEPLDLRFHAKRISQQNSDDLMRGFVFGCLFGYGCQIKDQLNPVSFG